jgi:hypothetical protein
MLIAILRIFRFFLDIRKTGFYEILSPFVYEPKNKTFTFRTVIYLDADFYNFVPDMSKIETEQDQDFYDFYHKCYQEHIKKIYTFLDNMNQGTTFWGAILVVPILLALNINILVEIYTWISTGIVPDFIRDFLIFIENGTVSQELLGLFRDAATLTLTYYIRSYLMSIAGKVLIKLGFFTAKIYKKRKARKQVAQATAK